MYIYTRTYVWMYVLIIRTYLVLKCVLAIENKDRYRRTIYLYSNEIICEYEGKRKGNDTLLLQL